MDLKFFATITATLLNILLGAFIIKKNYRSASNIYYGLMCISAGLWTFLMALLLIVRDLYLLENFIVKGIYVFGILVPLFYLLFAYHFPYKIFNYSKLFLFFLYLTPLLLIILNLTNVLKMQITQIIDNKVYQESIFYEFLIFSIYFFIYVLWGLIILIKKFVKETGIYRLQLKYLMIATIITFIICGIFSVILPLVWSFALDWLSPSLTLINFFIIGYYLFYKVKRV